MRLNTATAVVALGASKAKRSKASLERFKVYLFALYYYGPRPLLQELLESTKASFGMNSLNNLFMLMTLKNVNTSFIHFHGSPP